MQIKKHDITAFNIRLIFAILLVLICFGCLIARFIWLQIFHHQDYQLKAEENRIALLPIEPNRGLILDRNGIILARNFSTFTLEITPTKLKKPLKIIIEDLQKIINIEKKDISRFNRLVEDSKKFESLPIRSGLSDTEIAKISVIQNQLTGVEIKSRLIRNYPFGETGSHIIGYIGRISKKDAEKIQKVSDENDESNNYDTAKSIDNYNGTQHIGKIGIEQSYEYDLHGITGNEKVEVNSSGQALRALDTKQALSGNNISLSIDIKLQKLVEDLYGNQKGAFVAINPQNGEILAFVSKPTFNPNLFVDGIDNENWKILNNNPDKPLLNRALRSAYPPGSTYKPFMGLAGLEAEKITPEKSIADPGYFILGNHRFRDDKVGGHGSVNLYKSIVQSCDTYYYILARSLGVDGIAQFMDKLGFGKTTGIDIYGEVKGILPSTQWKKINYKKPEQQKWYEGETISLGIGQGYNNFTMLQMAQALSTIAMDGVTMQPHLAKSIYKITQDKNLHIQPIEKYKLNFKKENIQAVKNSMIGVAKEGTSAAAFAGTPYISAGKTGTSQVFTLNKNQKYDSKNLNKNLHDHALYTTFAPVENPQIAIAMIVENAGFGAQAAAPIARKALDYALLEKWPDGIKNINPNLNNINQDEINTIDYQTPTLSSTKIFELQKKALENIYLNNQ